MVARTDEPQNEGNQPRILIIYHCKANTGYAIETLEKTFWEMALRLTGTPENIFLCYPSYEDGFPHYVPDGFSHFLEFDFRSNDKQAIAEFGNTLKAHGINTIFGFDQPPNLPYYAIARKSGISKIIAYWGAPMSGLNKGLKLLLKKLEVKSYKYAPELYIFESRAMLDTATKGRGVQTSRAAICYPGVDTQKFYPDNSDRYYAHQKLQIDTDQKLIFYSGHFEPRKGVATIVEAANLLCRERNDITFILFGNKAGEEIPYAEKLEEAARNKVRFCGYHTDINRIHRSCYAGVIASTGWDSFTISSVEMQASGLPLLVSELQGLAETIAPEKTGSLFAPGDAQALADKITFLIENPTIRDQWGVAARHRVEAEYSRERHIEKLAKMVKNLV